MGDEAATGIRRPLVARPAAPELPRIDPPEPAERPAIEAPTRPAPSSERVGEPSPEIRGSPRRPASDSARRRTTVTGMSINVAAGRVALSTADGPPYRGSVDTDLAPGAYDLTVDRRAERWVFAGGQVRSGLRFDLTIDGPDPFTLDYAQPLLLSVSRGLDDTRGDTLAQAVALVDRAVYDHEPQRWADAVDYLCLLNEVDLYDVIDELEASHPGVAGELLLNFAHAVQRSDVEGQDGVLRALQSFVRPPAEYYVDGFVSWQVSPATWKHDETSTRKSNVQLVLSFERPPRALTVYAEDIGDAPDKESAPPVHGPLALTYPRALSLGTTPRLHAAKKAALAQIEAQNAEFIVVAFRLTAEVLLGVFQASQSVAQMATKTQVRPASRAERGPGRWEPTGQGGTNMKADAEAYELSSCGTPRGMGYYVDGVQFEGFKGGKLLDAKHWTRGGRMDNFIREVPWSAGEKIRKQATTQLRVASRHGVGVQWRVADRHVADALRAFMTNEGLPIEIVFIAP
ncbi:hypothetical protein [Microbacterium sp. No. 7]|uniref:hypothetical protein n=1 Tax=Microbacterium sp. No. 7 TaxID=1714373 RepID=UPI0006D26629|nr:hypothetical protein [Microbacterium sp. No. 7]ALJ21610.1 hypothetical protein AOA12_17610 [Microbacterium sp. No. 7]